MKHTIPMISPYTEMENLGTGVDLFRIGKLRVLYISSARAQTLRAVKLQETDRPPSQICGTGFHDASNADFKLAFITAEADGAIKALTNSWANVPDLNWVRGVFVTWEVA